MQHFTRKQAILAIIVLIGVALYVVPNTFYQLNGSVLGKLAFLAFVLFAASTSVVLGLAAGLLFIMAMQRFQFEGMTNADGTTATPPTADSIAALKASAQEKATAQGVDLEAVKTSLQSKASNTIPATKTASTEEVAPTSTETFKGSYAKVA